MIEVFIALIKALLWMIKWFMLTLVLATIILIGVMLIVAIYAKVKGDNNEKL